MIDDDRDRDRDRDRDNIEEKEKVTNNTYITHICYRFEIERSLWLPFKTICAARGKSIKNQLTELILNFVRENAPKHFGTVNIQEIRIDQMNLYQYIVAEEVRLLTGEIKKAIERDANPAYLNELKMQLLDMVRKNPTVTPELGEEIKAALFLLREGGGKR